MAISSFRPSEIATAFGVAMTRKFGHRLPQNNAVRGDCCAGTMRTSPYSNPIGEADPFIVNCQLSIVN